MVVAGLVRNRWVERSETLARGRGRRAAANDGRGNSLCQRVCVKRGPTWQSGEKVGRYWGVIAEPNIPWGDPEKIELSVEESKLVRRPLRHYIRATNRERRIRFIGKQIALSADEVKRCGGLRGSGSFSPNTF